MSSQTTNQTNQTNRTYVKSQMYEHRRSPSPEPREREYSPSPEPCKQERHGYQVPSKESYFFDRCEQPMVEICEATNSFQLLPDDFKFPMLTFICAHSHEGRPSVYGEYDAPPDWTIVESINGKGGYFLKKTAEVANIYLIWHHRQKNIYKFWGPSEREVRDAMNRIRGRIVKYVKYVVHGQTPAHGQPPTLQRSYNMNANNLADSPPPMTPKPMTMTLPQASKNYIKARPMDFPASCAWILESAQSPQQEPLRRTKSLKHGMTLETMGSMYYERSDEEEKEDSFRPNKLVRTDSMAISEIYGEESNPHSFGLSRSMSMAF